MSTHLLCDARVDALLRLDGERKGGVDGRVVGDVEPVIDCPVVVRRGGGPRRVGQLRRQLARFFRQRVVLDAVRPAGHAVDDAAALVEGLLEGRVVHLLDPVGVGVVGRPAPHALLVRRVEGARHLGLVVLVKGQLQLLVLQQLIVPLQQLQLPPRADERQRLAGRGALDVVVQVARPQHVVEGLVQPKAAPAQLGAQPRHQLAILRAPCLAVLARHVRVDAGQRHVVQAQRHADAALGALARAKGVLVHAQQPRVRCNGAREADADARELGRQQRAVAAPPHAVQHVRLAANRLKGGARRRLVQQLLHANGAAQPPAAHARGVARQLTAAHALGGVQPRLQRQPEAARV